MSALALPRSRPLVWANRAATVVLVVVLAVLVLGAGLRAAGLTPLVERSGSMAPAIAAGDVVLMRATPADALQDSDVVSLQDPLDERLVTHRVTSVALRDGRAVVVTRGDANASSERWVLRADEPVERMAARVPAVGAPLRWLASPLPRLVLGVLGAGLLAAALLRRIWSRP
ncbi:MAG TPA: signal peptidase I [Conexibacter sp.]|nr:signal peptidase I [Conexibacter sp.]